MIAHCTWRLSRGWSNFLRGGRGNPEDTREKKSESKANDCCRMCKCFFNVKYGTGKSGRMSTQNLYVASNRDGSRGEVLASMNEFVRACLSTVRPQNQEFVQAICCYLHLAATHRSNQAIALP